MSLLRNRSQGTLLKMIKISERKCPICGTSECEVLHNQRFVLPEGHPLSDGYDVVSCVKCGFVYADTTATQDDFECFYTKFSKYEDHLTATGGGDTPWDLKRLQSTAKQIATIISHGNDKTLHDANFSFDHSSKTPPLKFSNASILDIGCANGGLLQSLRQLGFENLCGIDPSSACVASVQRMGLEAYVGSLFHLPVEIGQFDCVILSHVLEHIENLNQAIDLIRLLTKTKGCIYIEVPDAARYFEFYVSPFHYFDIEHINHFSLKSLHNLLSSKGLISISEGEKEIPITESVDYPAVWIACSNGGEDIDYLVEIDKELTEKMKQYIALSQESLNLKYIDHIVSTGLPLVIWGVGSSTTRLLANSSLREANILSFVDSNPKYWGTELFNKPVVSPENLRHTNESIIITSKLYGEKIIERLVSELGIEEKRIIKIYS